MSLVNVMISGFKPSTLSVVLSLVLLAGCMPNKPAPEQWLADKELVVQSLQDAHVNNAKLLENIEALDQRVLSLETLSAQQDAKLIALEESVQAKKVAPKQQEKVSKGTSKELNTRLDVLSAKLNPSVVKPIVVPAPALEEKNAYTAAYLALKSGRYDEASAGFSAVVMKHVKGEYTDQAYYWLGESLVAQHKNKEAIDAFLTVANKYPNSPKHAAALLKLAAVYQSLGQLGDARATLARVIKEHPDSRTSERARLQLNSMPSASGDKK